MVKLTVFTPTYNRAHTLKRVYESLLKQTNFDFEWLIIDDGSTDDTFKLVKEFQNDFFPVHYYYQNNSGKHVATNKGMKEASGKYFTCLDSDDWFYPNTVKFIVNVFENNNDIKGLIALDTFADGKIVGEALPNYKKINWIDLRYKEKVLGDKCYVFRTNIIKNMLFPQYGNSKHMPPSYQIVDFSKKYEFYLFNNPIKFVEYQKDGITSNVKKNYFVSAENYCEYRKNIHQLLPNFKEKMKNMILFNISWIETKCSNQYSFKNKKNKIMSILLLPLSMVLYKNLRKKLVG